MGGGGGCCIGNCCVANCGLIQRIKDFFCSNSCCVGNSVSKEERYDSEKADLQATVRIQNALNEFKNDSQTKSDRLENDIIKESRVYLDEFIEDMKKYNDIKYGNRTLNINISSIERDNRKTENQIHGYITKRVIKRISLDDTECCEILKMDAGSAKTQKLNDFYKKVLKDAVKELSNLIRDAMEKQTDSVEDKIQQRIDSIVDVCETKTVEFEKIQNLKNKDEEKVEQEQIRLSHYISLCDCGLSILE